MAPEFAGGCYYYFWIGVMAAAAVKSVGGSPQEPGGRFDGKSSFVFPAGL